MCGILNINLTLLSEDETKTYVFFWQKQKHRHLASLKLSNQLYYLNSKRKFFLLFELHEQLTAPTP
jgi:hypothetical protein